jgi:predicted nucleic acid-binding protein
VIVLDASALAVALGDDGPDGLRVRERLRGHTLFSSDLVDLEVLGIIRRASASSAIDPARADQALSDLADLGLHRVPHHRYLTALWRLSTRFTLFEASYLSLAAALGVPLLTADRRLAQMDDAPCTIEVLA